MARVGRPLLFETVEELQEKIDSYFAECDPHLVQVVTYEYHKVKKEDEKGKLKLVDDKETKPMQKLVWTMSQQKPYTITGLAVHLGTSRETLINYEDRPEFFDTIKAAKDKCENFWENQLLGSNATGPIFNLKNNYNWKDKSEQDISHSGEVSISESQAEQLLRARARRSDS